MVASIQNPADAVNAALIRIGHKLTVGSLYDGSDAANAAVNIYGQTRDQLLRDGDWSFARRDVAISATKQAPSTGYFPPAAWDPATNPPLGFLFQYSWPLDCLKVRAIRSAPLFAWNFDPQPIVFSTPNDNTLAPPAKVIACNVGPDAVLTYCGQVTDPTQWEATFTETLIAELARRLAVALANMDAAKLEAADEQAEAAIAKTVQG